jgi:hypothetical protein
MDLEFFFHGWRCYSGSWQADALHKGEHAMTEREHAHELIDRLPEAQISALVGLLKTFVDPAYEDEEISEDETQAVTRSKEWFKNNQGTPFEDVVAELGFTMEQVRSQKETA